MNRQQRRLRPNLSAKATFALLVIPVLNRMNSPLVLTAAGWLAATRQDGCDARCTCSNAPAVATRASLELAPVAVAAENATAALRRAGTELDEAARRLEESDRYCEADALREAAQLLRVKARGLKNGETATAPIQSPKWTNENAPSAAGDRYGQTRQAD